MLCHMTGKLRIKKKKEKPWKNKEEPWKKLENICLFFLKQWCLQCCLHGHHHIPFPQTDLWDCRGKKALQILKCFFFLLFVLLYLFSLFNILFWSYTSISLRHLFLSGAWGFLSFCRFIKIWSPFFIWVRVTVLAVWLTCIKSAVL